MTKCSTGKHMHPTKAKALAHAHHHNNSSVDWMPRVSVYHCPVCGSWHVGHFKRRTPTRQQQKARQRR
jgi:hypothetical protein